jgi:UDP-N-acetylglucosamine 2-epimerase (non-hydrolysing)
VHAILDVTVMARQSTPVLHLIAGVRPNFMKLAPIVRALQAETRLSFKIVHTGQHYDHDMNTVFFEELGIPDPDVHLGSVGGGHAQQVGHVMVAYEAFCEVHRPDVVVVVGDVNSTMACAIVAKKLRIRLAHVEAGLRSGDREMPEEINRIVTDSITDWFFVTEPSGVRNLMLEGKAPELIHHVGHVMVDNLLYQVERLASMDATSFETDTFKRAHPRFGVVTLHRPSNVDDSSTLRRVAEGLKQVSRELPLAFPVHPRTRASLSRHEIDFGPGVCLLGPQSYMSFLHLWKDASVVLTDSGGLQEETTALGVPCLTIRDTTERPITVEEGTNTLIGLDPLRMLCEVRNTLLRTRPPAQRRPVLWDGRSASRIVEVLAGQLL